MAFATGFIVAASLISLGIAYWPEYKLQRAQGDSKALSTPLLPAQKDREEIPLPVHITIPSIGVDAAIELVGLTPQGTMASPATWKTVGWYQYGPKPGEKGNAILVGHLDSAFSANGVFRNLHKLHPGDGVVIRDKQGQEYQFTVTRSTTYKVVDVPLADLFRERMESELTLITCAGVWDWRMQTYTHRLVVRVAAE